MKLLNSKPAEIQKLLDDLDNEAKVIKENAIKLSWHMRGSVTYTDMLNMCPFEREAIAKLIDSNLETTKKTGLPFF